MSLQSRSIIAAMAAVFLLSIAILWPKPDRPVGSPLPDRIDAVLPQSAPGLIAPSQPAERTVAAVTAPHPKVVVTGPVDEMPPENFDGPAMPVVFSFAHRMDRKDVDDVTGDVTERNVRVLEGVLYNTSDRPLTVSVMEVDIPTQQKASAQVVMAKGAQRRFGAELGLKMLSGDAITLRSPGYRDITQIIP